MVSFGLRIICRIFVLFVDLEENRFCLQQWQHRHFLHLYQSSLQHGFCSSSSSFSMDWGKYQISLLLQCWVRKINNSTYNGTNAENLDRFDTFNSPFLFFAYRCGDFDRQCACPLLLHGDMLRICCRLHAATSLCLLFEGLEISSLGSVCPLCGLHSPLVVCLTVFHF